MTLLAGYGFLISFSKISQKVAKKERKKSLILAGKKMRIITCFGDRIRSCTFFMIVSDKDHQ